jgi:hypothetical protein
MKRAWSKIAMVVLALGLAGTLVGCESQPLHEACPLDGEVVDKGVCNGTTGTVSCVVKHHPQCDQQICLSYFSNPPICTKPCTTAADCPTGAVPDICYTYAEADPKTGTPAEKYCVPGDMKTGSTSK